MQDLVEVLENLPPKHEKEKAALLMWFRCALVWLRIEEGSPGRFRFDHPHRRPRCGSKRLPSNCKAETCQPLSSQSLEDHVGFLQAKSDGEFAYLVVHNIDGPGLRDDDIQRTLGIVAACPCVRLVASIDNVNAPLLWDKQMANTQFNWWWHHTPTYAHYTVEGTYLPLLLTAAGSLESVRSAGLVLKSLTPNAQSVFKTLAEFQLAHPDGQGLALHQLYSSCRERFLVSSELTLRAHLTEFKDHELVRWRRGLDGQDCLSIPLPAEALTKLLTDVFGT